MVRGQDVAGPVGVLFGWLTAAAAFPCALLTAALGQALGAAAGGCTVIGLSLPVDRQVWALVNQPTLHFAGQPQALGYWFGSLVVPLAAALLLIPMVPRPRALAAELTALHLGWALAVVAVAWQPLLDPADGHLARWLALQRLPAVAVWLAPTLAAVAAFPPTLRLLALARVTRPHSGRGLRLLVVAGHLAVPCLAWVAIGWAVGGWMVVAGATAALAPLAVAAAVAWFGYPAPFAHRLRPLGLGSWLTLLVAVPLVAATVALAGRPLDGGYRAGLVWAEAGKHNNLRPWIRTAPIQRPWRATAPRSNHVSASPLGTLPPGPTPAPGDASSAAGPVPGGSRPGKPLVARLVIGSVRVLPARASKLPVTGGAAGRDRPVTPPAKV